MSTAESHMNREPVKYLEPCYQLAPLYLHILLHVHRSLEIDDESHTFRRGFENSYSLLHVVYLIQRCS